MNENEFKLLSSLELNAPLTPSVFIKISAYEVNRTNYVRLASNVICSICMSAAAAK